MPDKDSFRAKAMLLYLNNKLFISLYKKATKLDKEDKYGLEISYYVPTRPYPLVIVEVEKNTNLIMIDLNIS